MMTASVFGLIPSALELSNLYVLCLGVLTGTLMLTLLEQVIPHVDPTHTKQRRLSLDTKSLMFLTAMTLHNVPEGLSVGVSFSSEVENLGAMVALAIGLQNAPEGFLIAVFLILHKVPAVKAVLFAAFTGLIEFAGGFAGYYFSKLADGLVPYGLSFAAGAMLFIVYKELIPESHGDGNERPATLAFIVGILTMVGMSHTLG